MPTVNGQHMRNFAPNSFDKSATMPNFGAVKQMGNGGVGFTDSVKSANATFNPPCYGEDYKRSVDLHNASSLSAANDGINLGATLGYENMPLHTWTREQLEHQLMILKNRESNVIQASQQWLAGLCAMRYAMPEMGIHNQNVIPPNMLPTMGEGSNASSLIQPTMNGRNPQQGFNLYTNTGANQAMMKDILSMEPMAASKLLNSDGTPYNSTVYEPVKHSKDAPFVEGMMIDLNKELYLKRTDTKLVSDDGTHMMATPSDAESEFDFNESIPHGRRKRGLKKDASGFPTCESSQEVSVSGFDDQSAFCEDANANAFISTLSGSLKRDYINFTKKGILSNELRQEYIRRSKLYPKVRGVWFNSTVRRMGWVGQAYKKCKRIEKIFSITKHGFDGARRLAIAFRKSQKPSGATFDDEEITMAPVDTTCSAATKDDYTVTETVEPELQHIEEEAFHIEEDPVEEEEIPFHEDIPNVLIDSQDISSKFESSGSDDEQHFDDNIEVLSQTDLDYEDLCGGWWVKNYNSILTKDQKSHRDYLCKGVLRFMLYELSVLTELEVPVPLATKEAIKRGVQYHIELLESCNTAEEMAPYMAIFGDYICRGITPVDMPFYELYAILRAFSHCRPLNSGFTSMNEETHLDQVDEESIIDYVRG